MARLHARHELSKDMGPDFFEPGMMEYPEQSDGSWDEATGELMLRFESKGTRYDGRTEQIEKVKAGDAICIKRDPENAFNPNNFLLLTTKGKDVGNMPAELCNAVAPLYDGRLLEIENAFASFVDPISKRSRHAKQAILFVELHAKLTTPKCDAGASETEPANDTSAETVDPYALQLDIKKNSFYIGGHEIRIDMPLSDFRELKFYEQAKEVQDLLDPDCLHVYLRHTSEYAGENWVVCLLFRNGYFRRLRHESLRKLLLHAAGGLRRLLDERPGGPADGRCSRRYSVRCSLRHVQRYAGGFFPDPAHGRHAHPVFRGARHRTAALQRPDRVCAE